MWREAGFGGLQGLVKLKNRPDSDASWEYYSTIHLLNEAFQPPIQPVTSLNSSESLPSSQASKPPAVAIERLTACAYEVLTLYGYDLVHTERSCLQAFQQMKLQSTGLKLENLMREMEGLLAFSCTHLGDNAAVYNGLEVCPKAVFFRNLEMSVIRKVVEAFHCTGETALCRSNSLYNESFSVLSGWTVRDDLLLLAAILKHGYGQWRIIAKRPEMSEKLKNCLGRLDAEMSSEGFLESRARFVTYCLMQTEYEEVEISV